MKPIYLVLRTPNGRETWKVKTADLKKEGEDAPTYGECDWSACELTLDVTHYPAFEVLMTALHEATHTALPYLKEKEIKRVEFNLRQILRTVGPALGLID